MVVLDNHNAIWQILLNVALTEILPRPPSFCRAQLLVLIQRNSCSVFNVSDTMLHKLKSGCQNNGRNEEAEFMVSGSGYQSRELTIC